MKHKLKCPACGCSTILMSSGVDYTAEIINGVVKKQKDSIQEEITYACCSDCGKCLSQFVIDEMSKWEEPKWIQEA